MIIRNPWFASLRLKEAKRIHNGKKPLGSQPPVERSYSGLNIGHFLWKMKGDSEGATKKLESRAKRCGESLLGVVRNWRRVPNWVSD